MWDVTAISLQAAEADSIGPLEATHVSFSSAASIWKRATARPSVALVGTPVSTDWMYESCRLAALIYCRMVLPRIPSAVTGAFPPLSVLGRDLYRSLTGTDASDCWGDMAGVLYWCSLVGGAAMRPVPDTSETDRWEDVEGSDFEESEHRRRWPTLLAVRLTIWLAFQYADMVTTTLRRFICVSRPVTV
ncbi:hypothetical protein W97_04318 [Coniosporium apollinis CBS 100218]|uniref:Transcription factor domain-containing protein n=1 Tax=Coniosporium apollinis (strain CBS 100218) TaxID=1168221 RepID=R7YTD5_CONA1|nr:uncharacterized protein W97_04318 [Coniosporium apollinis CBS 100218]EON65083.1 hypothetical protein W97_04318 [Coniosporium apollinis CBS 100218]